MSQVYYLRVNTSGVGQTALESEMIPEFFVVETDDAMIYSAPSAKAAEESVVLRCGVLTPERMEAQDEFFRLEQEFTLSLIHISAERPPGRRIPPPQAVLNLLSLRGGAARLIFERRGPAAAHKAAAG